MPPLVTDYSLATNTATLSPAPAVGSLIRGAAAMSRWARC